MIVKPKIVSNSGTGSITVRFLYLAIENGKLINKIVEKYCEAGGSVIPPNIPTSLQETKKNCSLTFNVWNHTNSQLTNIQHDLNVGATYITTDNKTHAFVVVDSATGYELSVTYYKGSANNSINISWGDGSANYIDSEAEISPRTATHTYSTAGTYEIKLWANYGILGIGAGTGTDFIRPVNSLYNLFLSNQLQSYALNGAKSLKILTFSSGFTIDSYYLCKDCYSLESIIIPIGTLTEIKKQAFLNCYSLNYASFPVNCTILHADGSQFSACVSLKNIVIDNSQTIPASCFLGANSLETVYLQPPITSIGVSSFDGSYSLKNINIPSTVESIGSSGFRYCHSLKTITLNRFTAPSTITILNSTITSLNTQCRIYVPVGSETVYKTATNWSTYANYIYEDTPENRALFGD